MHRNGVASPFLTMKTLILLIIGALLIAPLAFSDTYYNTTIENMTLVSDEANQAIIVFAWVGLGLLLLAIGEFLGQALFFFAAGAWFTAVAGIAVFTGTYINSVFYFLLALGSVYHGVNYVIENKNEENASKDKFFG